MLVRTWMIIWKEFLQIIRDPRQLAMVVIMPMIMLVLYGYAINLDVNHVQMAVFDHDGSRQSRDLIGAFANSTYFDITMLAYNDADITNALDSGRAKIALIIPVDYSRDLARGHKTPVQALVDGSDSATASTVVGYFGNTLQQQNVKIIMQALARIGRGSNASFTPINLQTRFWYNPELKSVNYIVPGLIAVILMMLATILTSATVVRERERGTIEPLLVSPVQPVELMLGKLIPYTLIAFFDVVLVTIVGVEVFHVPLRGSPALVLVLSGVFVIASLGIGLFISSIAPSQQSAMMASGLLMQLPSMMLSGFIFPITSMPTVIRLLTNIIPAAHFIKILREIFLKGSGLQMVWKPSLMLLLLGIFVVGLAIAVFRKKL